MINITGEIDTVVGILEGDALDRALRQLLIFCDSDETARVLKAWGQIDLASEIIQALRPESE